MKNICFYLLLMTSVLIARDNPFLATDAYEEEVARLMEINDDYPMDLVEEKVDYENMNSTLDIKENNNLSDSNKMEKDIQEKIKKELILKKAMIEKAKMKEKNLKKAQKKQAMLKKAKMKQAMIAKKKQEQMLKEEIIYVKKRSDLPDITKEYKPLDFLSFTYSNNIIKIKSSKYKVFKKFTIDNKIILDFAASDALFYTKRKDLNTFSFKNITIGNHKNENFFRVVIILNDKPSLFKVTHTEKLVSITRK